MPKYLIIASYTSDGIKGVIKDGGSKRRKAAESAFASVGARLEAFYFAFGSADAIVLVDLPDNTAAAALSLAVGATGAGSLRTTVLLTPKEIDAAAKAKSAYRAPGA